MKTSDQLIAKLGESLAKSIEPIGKAVGATSDIPSTETSDFAAKISISLYVEDLARLDSIISFMARGRQRINRSDAIKLALRGLMLDSELFALLRLIQKDDGRRRKADLGKP